jgi:hemerythrin-like domain-containing protein
MLVESFARAGGDVRAALLRDHEALYILFDEVLEAFHAGARDDARALWAQLSQRLDRHMRFEEQQVFPLLAVVHAAEVKTLVSEHDALRRALDGLGADLERRSLKVPDVEAFIALLRSHARRENALAYPWVDANMSLEAPGP